MVNNSQFSRHKCGAKGGVINFFMSKKASISNTLFSENSAV